MSKIINYTYLFLGFVTWYFFMYPCTHCISLYFFNLVSLIFNLASWILFQTNDFQCAVNAISVISSRQAKSKSSHPNS